MSGFSSWFRDRVRLGREPGKNALQAMVTRLIGLWGKRPTTDYSRNKYRLYQAMYYCCIVDGEGREYIRGSATAKPIVNSTAAFAIGNGFEAQVDGAEEIAAHQNAQDKLKDWIESQDAAIFDVAKFAYRDGDSFTLVQDDGSLEDLDPETVDVIYDPLSGQITGYDIKEVVDEEDEQQPVTYVRQFRTTSVRYTRVLNGQTLQEGTVIYERWYTSDGLFDPIAAPEDFDMAGPAAILTEVPLPVIHYANEPERKAIYGNSELQSLLTLYRDYNDVMAGAVENDVYNNMPIPVVTGAGKTIESLDRDSLLSLNDAQGKAFYMTTDPTASNSGTLLEYLFCNIVQTSETPEFILGTAVQSSKASTSTQMPVVVKKATRKRKALQKVLHRLVDAYVWRQYMAGDPDFYAIFTGKVPIAITFPPIVDEDGQLTLDTIDMLVRNGLLSDETALELSVVAQRIPDIAKEVEQAKLDAKDSNARNNVYPAQFGRPQDELEALDDDDGDEAA